MNQQSDEDTYNLLNSPQMNIVATFIAVQIFIWTYLGIWSWHDQMLFDYDPALHILNDPIPYN